MGITGGYLPARDTGSDHGLVSPVEQLWIDPLNALSESMTPWQATEVLGDVAGLQVAVTSGGMTDEIAEAKNGPENHLQVQESH